MIAHLKIESVLFLGNSSDAIFENVKTSVFNLDNSASLNRVLAQNSKFDMVYFSDADKTLPCLFQKILPLVHNNSVFILEKPHNSKEKEKIWKQLKKNKHVRVSVDTFSYGFLFFRKEQAKEHFSVQLG